MKKTTPGNTISITQYISAVVLLVVLVLAPLFGGKDELVRTAALSITVAISALAFVWKKEFYRPPGVWPIAIFVGLLAGSAAVTASMHATVQYVLYFASCASAAIIASSAFKKNDWFLAGVIALVGVGLILGAMGVSEYVQHCRAFKSGDWRVFGPFFNPGFFGGCLVLMIPATLALLLSIESPVGVLGSALAWAFELAAVFLTGTRFAIISLAIALFVFASLMVWRRCFSKLHLCRLGIAALIAAVAIALASAPTMNRVTGKEAAVQGHSTAFRKATWMGTVRIIRAHPLLGTGTGTFGLVFPKYTLAGPTQNAHDSYLQIASEAGIPALIAGALAFLVLLCSGLQGIGRDEKSPLLLPRGQTIIICGIIAALVGGLVRNLADSDLYNPGIGFTFWIMAGLLASRAASTKSVSLRSGVKISLSLIFTAVIAIWTSFVVGRSRADEAALLESTDPYAAIESYRAAVNADPLCAEYRLRLGEWGTAFGSPHSTEWDNGIKDLKRAIQLEPMRAKNWMVLGRILLRSNEKLDALDAFRQALKFDPNATPAMLQIARILGDSKDTEVETDKMYRRLLAVESTPFETLNGAPEMVNPDYAWGHYYFGKKYLSEKRSKLAAKEFQSAIDRLELRKSFKVQLRALAEIGKIDPEEESVLDQLLEDSKAGLSEAERH